MEKPVGFINGGTTDRPYLPDEMYHDVSLHIPEGDYQTVFGLNVLPDYRHQGIAGKLVDYFVELARKRGKKGVILTCKERLMGFMKIMASNAMENRILPMEGPNGMI